MTQTSHSCYKRIYNR